jgi:aspartate racemase
VGCELNSRNSGNADVREKWGVLGGMGPRASASFLELIYQNGRPRSEQELPIVYLLSDPSVPDRTEALLSGNSEVLLKRLTSDVENLVNLGATKIVLCCVTMHHLIPRLPAVLRRRIVSLVEIIVRESLKHSCRQLLLCTDGSRRLGLFEARRGWKSWNEKVVMPSATDQRTIHRLIYQLKIAPADLKHFNMVQNLAAKYRAEAVIAGCTEISLLLARVGKRKTKLKLIDPLSAIAREMR